MPCDRTTMKLGAVVQRGPPTRREHGQVEAWDGAQHVRVNVLREDPTTPHRYLLDGIAPLARWSRKAIRAYANIDDLTSARAHHAAWHHMGIRLVRASAAGPDVFAYHDAPDDAVVDVGDDEWDMADDVDVDSGAGVAAPADADLHGYADDGFVVPDHVGAPFSPGDPSTSTFVRDTHEAVRAYRDAVPSTRDQRRFRTWMDAFETRVAHRDDEAHFARGTAAAAAYTYPPTAAPPRPAKRRRRR